MTQFCLMLHQSGDAAALSEAAALAAQLAGYGATSGLLDLRDDGSDLRAYVYAEGLDGAGAQAVRDACAGWIEQGGLGTFGNAAGAWFSLRTPV